MEKDKKRLVYKITMLILLTATITFMITSIGMHNYYTKIGENTQNLELKLETIKKKLESYYIGEIDTDKMTEAAIKGYVEGLDDEYTEYLTKDEYEELMVSVIGDYVGIGIYMYQDLEGNVVVLLPIEGSPALEEDLQQGDIIKKINGIECAGLDLNLVSSMIKGEEGTKVELEILRGTETLNKTITRRKVELQDSSAKILDGNIGYIELLTFDQDCTKNVKKYIEDFQSKGVKSLIIDLRDNTGGIVTETISLSELFIKKDDIIMRSYDKDGKEKVVKSTNKNPIDMEIILLVNEYSASATELFAGAMQDNKVAKLVGVTTYGKGVMQEIIPIFEGALKITIEEFKTPNNNTINKKGITPDEIVEENLATQEDEQLLKAIELINK